MVGSGSEIYFGYRFGKNIRIFATLSSARFDARAGSAEQGGQGGRVYSPRHSAQE